MATSYKVLSHKGVLNVEVQTLSAAERAARLYPDGLIIAILDEAHGDQVRFLFISHKMHCKRPTSV